MSRELQLFLKDELDFKEKFYKLMDILISNQQNYHLEAIFFMGLNYLQILSLFYSEQIGIFNHKNSKSDLLLNYIEKIIRIKDLFKNNYSGLKTLIYILFIFTIIFILYFIIICSKINSNSSFSTRKNIFNYFLKIFLFLSFNIILDICMSNFCFGSSKYNPNFDELVECKGKNVILIDCVSFIFIILTFCLHIFLQIFYTDLFFFSNSSYAKLSCNYDYYMDINSLFNSFFMIQSYFFTKEVFLLFNIFYSIIMFIYYFKYFIFYDSKVNLLCGLFHSLYAWTSIFGIIFIYFDFKEKGIIYIISCILVSFTYLSIKHKIEKDIFYNKSPSKIKNIYHLLFFFKTFIEKIIRFDKSRNNRAFVSGVIQVLLEEAPNSKISEQVNGEIYLPLENKWSDPKKAKCEDDVFRKYFIVIMMNYYLFNKENCPDLYLNLSLYYLLVIQNYCQAMYYFQKISQLKLNYREQFTYMRLKIKIQYSLIKNLRQSDEKNVSLENLDISMYYKYDSLSQNFIEEITNDIELSLEFWKTFKKYERDINFKINFNKVFKLTDKIQTTKRSIEKMWQELLKIYNGVNEFFELYNNYIEQINDNDLKKRDLDSLKRKKGYFNEQFNNNYYSTLFSKDTGIIIADGDIGSEGIIKHCNKRIENIFKYNISELKEVNVTKLMPRIFAKNHSKYIERYFRIGEKKYMETSDFKTFGKEKNNSILQIKLALKLLPILNYNVFFVGLIIKENIDDIILIDRDYIIQGMSSKLMKILNIENNFLFQDNEIPFYMICKKFVNFYNIFLKNKNNEILKEFDKKATALINEEKNNIKLDETDNDKKNYDEIQENIEINENVELEYEIKIPQFLIDYSEKTKYKMDRYLFMNQEDKFQNQIYESSENIDSEDNDEEGNELLPHEKSDSSNKKENLEKDMPTFGNYDTPTQILNNSQTPGVTPTPFPTPVEAFQENMKYKILSEQSYLFLKTKEERIYYEKLNQYLTLFKEEKFNELEDLIDLCNKDSSSSEYKFNFTFDNNKFGNKEISYIIRCIDNKNQEGESEEKSIGDMDLKTIKYKKEKEEAIKPLFELLEYEREEIMKLPELFLKLSMENKDFQDLLEEYKNEIVTSSKTYGQKKPEILEDENSSQTSQSGFDNGLLRKNRIEEIKANLFENISNFYTLKYIRMCVILIMLFTIAFSIIYLFFILNFNTSLESVSEINLDLFQTTLRTTELISIFISLKTLLLVEMGRINIDFLNFESENITDNSDYYREMKRIALDLYFKLIQGYGNLEKEIPKYLDNSELLSLYWDHINISFVNNNYKRKEWINESFPLAMDRFLCNCAMFLKFNYSEEFINSKKDEIDFELLFDYLCYIIIENAYNNIVPNQFNKLKVLPNVFIKFNSNKKVTMILIITVFAGCLFFLCFLYFVMIRITNKSMTDGFIKITKIKLEKIEERIKKIETFNLNLKKFRDRDNNSEDSKFKTEIVGDKISQKKLLPYKSSTSFDNGMNDKNEKKFWEERASIIGNNGFNIDVKRYLPLTILTEYYFHAIIIVIFLCAIVLLIYYVSITMIQDINQLLFIQKFIYGKLISSSTQIFEMKCFISSCQNNTILDYSEFKSFLEIRKLVIGLKNFEEANDYYNNQYLLDACDASIDRSIDEDRYKLCLNESIIGSANNTDNLLKLIDNIIDNIYKQDEMDLYLKNNTNITINQSHRLNLFNKTNFQMVEHIFYNYIFSVGDLFEITVKRNLNDYLQIKKRIVILLVFGLALIIILYCIIFLIFYIPRLIHFLSVSCSVMKIIPTSIIMITPELENWIENKY